MTQFVTTTKRPTLIDFPCEYVLKVMGGADDGFDQIVFTIVSNHVNNVDRDAFRERLSRGGKYKSLSVAIELDSQYQLEQLYIELNAHDAVLMVL